MIVTDSVCLQVLKNVETAEGFYSRETPITRAFQRQVFIYNVGKERVSERPASKMTGGSENGRGERPFSYKSLNRITFEVTVLFDFTERRSVSVSPLFCLI
jgi:hypothetical protein